jgi:hypothetical protein
MPQNLELGDDFPGGRIGYRQPGAARIVEEAAIGVVRCLRLRALSGSVARPEEI